MLRMSKLTDYGLVLLTHLAQAGPAEVRTAHELAERSRIPLPTVSKILNELSKAGLVGSHRGRRGGYSLSRAPEHISVAAVVDALEGPVGLTECSAAAGSCSLEPICVTKDRWGLISLAIQRTLQRVPLSALGGRPARAPAEDAERPPTEPEGAGEPAGAPNPHLTGANP